ncbi:MAG: MFS transporter [Ectothiorhodospiraceae bacterium]|nr:MFS transporter [Ectothiorhodospiraceae bacterium]
MSRDDSIETPYGWVVIAVSLTIHTIGLAAPTLLFVSLKPIAADFDWPRAVPSFAYSLLMVGSGIGGIAMGWWLDRRGIVQPVLFGAVMIALGAFVASRADGQWSFYFANGVLIGLLGKAAMIAPLMANATRWFDRRRGLAVSILASGQGLAGTLWPSTARYLNETVGWRDTYLYFAVLALVTMVPLTFLLRPKPPQAPPTSALHGGLASAGRALGLPSSMVQGLLWLAVVGCCTGMAVPIVHLASHATDLGFSAARGAEMLSVLFVAAFVSRIVFGMIADRIGGMRTLLVGSTCQAVMLLVFSQVESLVGLYVAALLFGIGFSGIMPCYPLVIRLLFPASEAGWRIASQYLFAAMGMALGGWMGGVVYDHTGSYTEAFLLGLAFNVMNFSVMGWVYLRQRQQPTPSPVAI